MVDNIVPMGSGDLDLHTRMGKVLVNGAIGNSPGPRKSFAETEALLDTVADPITLGSFTRQARTGNKGNTYYDDGEGIFTMNSIGLTNPGLENSIPAIEALAEKTQQAGKELIISVSAFEAEDFAEQAAMLEGLNLSLELNLSCPNTEQGGRMFATDHRAMAKTFQLVRRVFTGNLIAKLTYHPDEGFLYGTAQILSDEGVNVVAILNTLIGIIINPEKLIPEMSRPMTYGGVSGHSINPMMLGMVYRLRMLLGGFDSDIDIIAEGGINSGFDILAAKTVGASVCRNANLYARKGPAVLGQLTLGFVEEMMKRDFGSLNDIPRLWEWSPIPPSLQGSDEKRSVA